MLRIALWAHGSGGMNAVGDGRRRRVGLQRASIRNIDRAIEQAGDEGPQIRIGRPDLAVA